MAYSLSGIKTFTGMEGYGFNANLLLNGKKVAEARDDASGGPMWIEWMGATSTARNSAQAAFEQFAKAQYVANDGHAKHVASMVELGLDPIKAAEPQADSDIAESWINEQIDAAAIRKQILRWSKTKTVFQLVGDKSGEYRTLSKPWTPQIDAMLRAKHGAKIAMVSTRSRCLTVAVGDSNHIPDWALPARPDALALFEVAALLELEGLWIRLDADTQRAVLGFPVFGKQEFLVDDSGVTVRRSTGFGQDRETSCYSLEQVTQAVAAQQQLKPGY